MFRAPPEVGLGARQVLIELHADLAERLAEIRAEALEPADEIDARIAVDRIDLVIVDPGAPLAVHIARERRWVVRFAIAEMIGGHLPIPRIALEGELEIAPPDFVVVQQRARLRGRHVIVEAVIAGIGLEPIALQQRTRTPPPAMRAPILRAPPIGAERLVVGRDRGDDIVGTAELGQRELDAGAGGLSGFQENEFMLVRDDHLTPVDLPGLPPSFAAP